MGDSTVRQLSEREGAVLDRHLVLTDDVIQGRPVFVIGDVHGCYEELCELLEKAKQELENFIPIFVGDLINKGPKSIEVLNLVENIDAYCVRGNHEDLVLEHLKETDANYFRGKWSSGLTASNIDYISKLPYTISIPSLNAIIVHAGLVPGKTLTNQTPGDMVNMRNLKEIAPNQYEASHTVLEGTAWASVWPGPEHVYFGHNASRGLQECEHATGLDTACVRGGELTGIALGKEIKDFITVKAKCKYSY